MYRGVLPHGCPRKRSNTLKRFGEYPEMSEREKLHTSGVVVCNKSWFYRNQKRTSAMRLDEYIADRTQFYLDLHPLSISTASRWYSLPSQALDELEQYLKNEKAVRTLDDVFISAMRSSFPDIRSVEAKFEYISDRPAIQGKFTFSSGEPAMKGRYLIILITEQAALYTCSWSAQKRRFAKWDKQSRGSVESLKISVPPARDVAFKGGALQTRS